MAYTTLGAKAVGDIVKLKVNGTEREFLVVQQGTPSDMYSSSCYGTWLLMKDCYEERQWDSSDNEYGFSSIHAYLNGTFLGLFEANIKNAIKQVRIPFLSGSGENGKIASGSSGLSCKIFLLGGYEVGFTTSDHSYFPMDGDVLSYFQGWSNDRRIAKLNGRADMWWLRSPYLNYSDGVWSVKRDGGYNNNNCVNSLAVRPALIFPPSLLVSDSGDVTTNTAPTTPESITIPDSISGGTTITVSWGESTDAENNLNCYIVERSVNGGDEWTQIYQGDALTTTNNVPFGTPSVMYRVKARDTEGLESGWKTSGQVTVINNVAPGAPASITVPNMVDGGKTLLISWAKATDSDDNLSGYELERQVDGAEPWTQIYKGENLSFTDNITKGWNTVAYRVRAYDALDAVSAYTTSPTRTVNNNTAPTITCDQISVSDLGEKNEDFTITYSVDDVDADSVTVTETIDDVTLRSYSATLKKSESFEVTGLTYQKILNGSHTLAITASDGKAQTVHTLTFTKQVTSAMITLSEPMTADAKITVAVLSVLGEIPSDANFKVEVTNNASDDEPAWEDCTDAVRKGVNHVFTNDTATSGFAFNFRVTVSRGENNTAGYIKSIQGGFQ